MFLFSESCQPEVPLDRQFLANELKVTEDTSSKSVWVQYNLLSNTLSSNIYYLLSLGGYGQLWDNNYISSSNHHSLHPFSLKYLEIFNNFLSQQVFWKNIIIILCCEIWSQQGVAYMQQFKGFCPAFVTFISGLFPWNVYHTSSTFFKCFSPDLSSMAWWATL